MTSSIGLESGLFGSPPHLVTAEELAALVSPRDAVDVLEAAFSALDGGGDPPRTHQAVPGGELLLMPASGPGGVGVKLVTIARENPAAGRPLIQGVYVLFSPATLSPAAIVEGAALTALRTSAVSALATRHLARPDARRLVIFGGGTQAEAHALAVPAVRPIEHIAIIGTGSARTAELVERLQVRGLPAELDDGSALEAADVVCTCTTSTTPLFEGHALAPGTHVNAIGAYRPDMCELPALLLRRARVFVESRAAALREGGDLVRAIAAGTVTADCIDAELSDVVRGAIGARTPDEITVFKSVGLAVEDLAVANALAARLAPPGPPVASRP